MTVILNANFESFGGWLITVRGAGKVILQDTSPHTGIYCALIGESARACSYAKMYQSVTIPLDATTLSFWSTTYKNTWGFHPWVEINGEIVYRADDSVGARTTPWEEHIVDIRSYAGQTIELAVVYHDDIDNDPTWCFMGDHGAWMRVDDFTIALGLPNVVKITFEANAPAQLSINGVFEGVLV